jgi:hypothetical protein
LAKKREKTMKALNNEKYHFEPKAEKALKKPALNTLRSRSVRPTNSAGRIKSLRPKRSMLLSSKRRLSGITSSFEA